MFSKLNVNSDLSIWLNYIKKQHDKAIDMSLDRIRKVAKKMNLLNLNKFIITVTGTNGKGTTCSILESIFLNSGIKTGVYSSPHLICYSERIRINGKNVSKRYLCSIFSLIEHEREEVSLTYFEYGTLAALKIFQESNLDVVILEVGMGGRFDATNIIDSNISVIVNIGLDHENWLGKNREDIGYQKSGIFRKNQHVVIGEQHIPKSVLKISKELNVNLFRYKIDWNFYVEKNFWHWYSKRKCYKFLPIPKYVFLENVSVALAVINVLEKNYNIFKNLISVKSIQKSLIHTKLPGRFQIFSKLPKIILDVAHNPHASYILYKKLFHVKRFCTGKLYAISAMLVDKDIKNTLLCLKPIVDCWYLSSLSCFRGADSSSLARYFNVSYQFPTVKEAWETLKKVIDENDILIVFGSFNTVYEFILANKNH
ncbi:hypothetical protein AOQ88_01920 [Candidatus Riesia sp. GBBU]|nr:hypothetical protein AOQ88_01920 [Candidatus Riesia sp. GBBU]